MSFIFIYLCIVVSHSNQILPCKINFKCYLKYVCKGFVNIFTSYSVDVEKMLMKCHSLQKKSQISLEESTKYTTVINF